MKPLILFTAAMLIGTTASADTADVILSDQPFMSKPWANGDYYTVALDLNDCMLSKTITEFDKTNTPGDTQRIDIDLSEVDPVRTELVSDAVTLWANEGTFVMCTDIVGEDCVVAERPGEQISVPASVEAGDYLQAFKDQIAACQ